MTAPAERAAQSFECQCAGCGQRATQALVARINGQQIFRCDGCGKYTAYTVRA